MSYEYSSVQIDVPSSLSEDIIQWGKQHVTDDDIFVSQRDPTFGREDEIHITILYGLHAEKSNEVEKILSDSPPLFVKLGRINVFPNPKFDVVVIDVHSDDLEEANKKLTAKVEYTNQYNVYRPHVTIAYVKRGKGWKHAGCARWEGKNFVANHVVFSSKNGTKNRIPLTQ